MSHSRKKNWRGKDRNPFMKNYANRKLRKIPIHIDYDEDDFCEIDERRTNFPLDNRLYKKYTCSYDICDWNYTWTYKEILKRASELYYPTAKDTYVGAVYARYMEKRKKGLTFDQYVGKMVRQTINK